MTEIVRLSQLTPEQRQKRANILEAQENLFRYIPQSLGDLSRQNEEWRIQQAEAIDKFCGLTNLSPKGTGAFVEARIHVNGLNASLMDGCSQDPRIQRDYLEMHEKWTTMFESQQAAIQKAILS